MTTKKEVKANIAQAGIIRALETRGFSKKTEETPFELVHPQTKCKVFIHADKVIVDNTKISVSLGKGAITKLMNEIKILEGSKDGK